MSKLCIVAGTDVEAPAPRRQNGAGGRKEVDHLLKPTLELFERYKQARLEYERAVEEVARTGHTLRHLGSVLAVMRKRRAAKFEPEGWCDLM
jgi:hypothetical protein